MNIAEEVRGILQNSHPRVHVAVRITVCDNTCMIMLGAYSIALTKRSEGGFLIYEKWVSGDMPCSARGYCADIPIGIRYLERMLSRFDRAVFLLTNPWELATHAKYPLLEQYIKPANETAHRLWFSSDHPGVAHVEAFIRAIHDIRAAICALLPQPIAEEVVENYWSEGFAFLPAVLAFCSASLQELLMLRCAKHRAPLSALCFASRNITHCTKKLRAPC